MVVLYFEISLSFWSDSCP